MRKNKEDDRKYQREYYLKNAEKIANRMKLYYADKPETRKLIARKSRLKNAARERQWRFQPKQREKAKKQQKLYAARPEVKAKRNLQGRINQKRSYQRRYHSDPQFKLSRTLRSRIRMALKRRCKTTSTINLLGCPIADFLIYLESKFEVGMTWENYGTAWHVDHIMPCAIFDLTKPEHQKRCFHFSNLQPLFASENIKKGTKIVTNQYNLL